MSQEALLLSEKYKSFIRCNAPVEFLEGTTYAGKTTVGVFKFMLKVAQSKKKLHIIAAADTGTAEKNIIDKDLGILDNFGDLTEYNGNGTKDNKIPHILFHTNAGDKIIYVMGYSNKEKWKKALGGQYGCLYIDEINTADLEFVREASMRCDYLMGTLNPDDPELQIYKDYINHARPLPEWAHETPKEILDELKEEPKPGWVHWFFSFKDNRGLTKEKQNKIITNVPKGSRTYKNKIEGIRGKAEGLVFMNFEYSRNVRNKAWVKGNLEKAKRYDPARSPEEDRGFKFKIFSCGVDTAYSDKSPDTISLIFQGITDTGILITLDEEVFNNADLQEPLAPSDVVDKLMDFLARNRKEWGFSRFVFVDSADQATIKELDKFQRRTGTPYTFGNAYKKTKIIDRIIMQRGWIQNGQYIVLDHCTEHLSEINKYSYDDKGQPEDRNDHTINANQYAWLPYMKHIGNSK